MKIDVTLKITPEIMAAAQENLKKALAGHLGTHFDVMNKEFPLEYTERNAIVFDVSKVSDRDIDICDIDLAAVEQDMFVIFYTGYIEKVDYGTKLYFTEHPQLSHKLVDALLEKKISLIGIDCSGVRNGAEHTLKDQYCADRGVFIIENMWNLKAVVDQGGKCLMHTYPLNYAKWTGLPCRIIAEV